MSAFLPRFSITTGLLALAWASAGARAAGGKQVVVTPGLFPSLRDPDADLRAMPTLGGWIELAWPMHHTPAPAPGVPPALAQPPVPFARAAEVIRKVGARHIALSSDFGQADNPPRPEDLRSFVATGLAAGITPAEIDLMLRRIPARVLGHEP
jgi:hypothetical protein